MGTLTLLTLSAFFLGACHSGGVDPKDTEDSSAEGDTDTDTDTDSDTDADGDTDADTDTDVDTTILTFDIEGETGGTALTLTWFDPWTDSFEAGEEIAGGEGEANVSVAMPTPSEDELRTPDPTNWPSFQAAAYLPALHVDHDGDGLQDSGEPYVGAGLAWPLYAVNVPAELAMAGVVEGWNALQLDMESGDFQLHDIDAIPLEAGLWPEESVTVAGRYAGDIPASGMGLAAVPMNAFEGAPISSLLYDEVPLPVSFEITLDEVPPYDHFMQDEEIGLSMAIEMPLAYIDTDRSGGLSDGDLPAYMACHDRQPVMAIYIAQPEDLVTAYYMQAFYGAFGLNTGWWAGSVDPHTDEPIALSREELQNLVIDDSCSLE
jgi:hypothetical protein